jgi:uncharacterized membrane protein
VNINPAELFIGFVFSVFGFYFYKQGRKNINYAWVFIGLILIIYPYFISNFWWEFLIGAGLMGLAYSKRN